MTSYELITLRFNAHFESLDFFRREVARCEQAVYAAHRHAILMHATFGNCADTVAGYERVVEAAAEHEAAYNRLRYEIDNSGRMKRGLE